MQDALPQTLHKISAMTESMGSRLLVSFFTWQFCSVFFAASLRLKYWDRLLKNISAQGAVLERDTDLAKQSSALGAALPLNHLPSIPTHLFSPHHLCCSSAHPVCMFPPWCCYWLSAGCWTPAFHRDVCDWNQIQYLTVLKNTWKSISQTLPHLLASAVAAAEDK